MQSAPFIFLAQRDIPHITHNADKLPTWLINPHYLISYAFSYNESMYFYPFFMADNLWPISYGFLRIFLILKMPLWGDFLHRKFFISKSQFHPCLANHSALMIGNPSRIEIWNELGSRAEPLDRLVLSIKPELALDFSIPRS